MRVQELTKEQLLELSLHHTTYNGLIRSLGLAPNAGNQRTLKTYLKKHGIEFFSRPSEGQSLVRIPDEIVFSENSTSDRKSVRERIIKRNLIPYLCSDCGILPEWNGRLLTLQLDHINGVSNDHRLFNLRFLCPNCHSQTETFGTKRFKKLNKRKTREQVGYEKFLSGELRKVKRPDYPTLLQELKMLGYVGVGKKYGVSDNAVRKWLKLYEKHK